MSEPAFTAGPWIVNPVCARVDCAALSEKGGLLPVAQMLWPTDERSETETEANAALISAAPDLYAACEAMLDAWFDYHDRHNLTQPVTGRAGNAADIAIAALAKARGDQ